MSLGRYQGMMLCAWREKGGDLRQRLCGYACLRQCVCVWLLIEKAGKVWSYLAVVKMLQERALCCARLRFSSKMLPTHRARILFLEQSAEATHIETEGVIWIHHASSYIVGVFYRSMNESMIACCLLFRERSYLVWFILLCFVDGESRQSMIVFGLVYLVMLGWSRRPAERDRIRFGLFCDA